jgi:hypothetical protein
MIKTLTIAALAVITLVDATISSARSQDRSDAAIAAGVAAAIVGGVVIGNAYKKQKKKREEKKLNKRALSNHQEFQKDAAGDKEAFKAKWAPRCQKVQADLKAANCMGKTTLKCRKIAADCPG